MKDSIELKNIENTVNATAVRLFGEAGLEALEKPMARCPVDFTHAIEFDKIKEHINCTECNKIYHVGQCTYGELHGRILIYQSITNILGTTMSSQSKLLNDKLLTYKQQLLKAREQNLGEMVIRLMGRIEAIETIKKDLNL
jgi:hypothetical protein